MKPGTDSSLAEQMRARGLRVTSQRMAVSRCLLEAGRHLTAEDVRRRLQSSGCRCSRATIYNALNDLARNGLLQKVAVDERATFFDPVTEPHPHLYLGDRGELVDLPSNALPATESLGLPEGIEVTRISLVVHA